MSEYRIKDVQLRSSDLQFLLVAKERAKQEKAAKFAEKAAAKEARAKAAATPGKRKKEAKETEVLAPYVEKTPKGEKKSTYHVLRQKKELSLTTSQFLSRWTTLTTRYSCGASMTCWKADENACVCR